MAKKKKPLEIDMIAGSQLRDTQGEMLSVEGADISELIAGRGRLNDNHGKGFFNAIGRVTGAKKIFKREDCENERQEYYWEKVKAPFIYVKGYLYDDEDHPNARAAAAILRNIHKADTPLMMKASVEGGVVARGISDSSLLARTKIHSVALTFTPANNNTLVEPLNLEKSDTDESTDILLIKSVMHLAETDVPSFRHIVRDASATKVQNNLLKLVDLMKGLGIEGEINIPSKQKILEKAIEQKIQNNVLKIHEMMTLLREDEQLDKGLKDKIGAAIVGTSLTMSPSYTKYANTPKSTVQQEVKRKPSSEEVYKEVATKNPMLGAIGKIESSGGKNLKHETVNVGIHKGHTAGGIFGMMPHSAAFIIKKDPDLAKKYPELAEAAKDINKNHKKFTEALNSDPSLAADFAISMYNRNKGKTKSKHQLVYSWYNGLKGSWNALKEGGHKAIESHPYVQKVMEEYKNMQPKKVEQKQGLNKALMAGYDGSGAPTSRTNGSVIQAESLNSKPGFKYICCDNCGKEQIYAKHQVKCRDCGHSMSFEKLYSVMCGDK
jgi:ribosomal protein S27E